MKINLKPFLLSLFFFFNGLAYSAENLFEANKYVENISPATYMGGPQVWTVEVGGDGYVYFATGFNLSVWDGVRWSSYNPGKSFYLRSLSYDPVSKRLYCAGDNIFGYWQKDEIGDFNFSILFQTNNVTNGNVFWRIIPINGYYYLQTHENIYKYNPADNKIVPIVINRNIGYIHNVGGVLYAQIDNKFYVISEDNLSPIGLEMSDRVVNIVNHKGNLFFFTENQGIQVLRNNRFEPINSELNSILKQHRVFSVCSYGDDSFLVGTVLDGVYIVDSKGIVSEKFSETNDLNFTTVLSMAVDNYKNIWLGLDGGIATIPNNPNERYYKSIGKKIGNVYAVLTYRDRLYVGTNKGLYVVENHNPPKLIVNTQGQVWDLLQCGEDIIVNHDKGLLRLYDDDSFEVIHENSWMINQWYQEPNIYYVSDKTGFAIYEIKKGHLTFRNRLENYTGYFNRGLVDKYGNMWINGMSGQVRRLVIDKDKRVVKKNLLYKIDSKDNWIGTNIIDNEVVFSVGPDCFNYDIDKDSIVKNPYFSQLFQLLEGNTDAVVQSGNTFLFASDAGISRVERINDKFVKVSDIFPSIRGQMIPVGFRRFQKDSDGQISFGFANGVAFYDLQTEQPQHSYKLDLSKIEYSQRGEVKHSSVQDSKKLIEFPNNIVDLKFFFTGFPGTYQIEYSIDDSPWKSFSISEPLKFAYLEEGTHSLKLRGIFYNLDEQIINFDIKKSFTSTIWFLLLLILVFFALIYIVRVIISRRIKALHLRLIKRQEEAFERERIKHENELLALEIHERDKKLTSIAMNDIHINNMLNEIQAEILEIQTNDALIKSKLRSVLRKITSSRRNDNSWKVFEKYFNNVYDGFFDKLMERYPSLTNNDLKICSYIKLRLSTKEIAVLMNISPTSVETARHRLRKNLGISADVSLTELIVKI
ncbi:MAG: hypothetical protein ACD_77C00236G0006 [uncultured bacterium]|nr:MAG: hypothetical protein ACD_77C00236G0006 [uncultured bacterium]HBY00936.1 hypothetical protein [Rikenellaceae bacterium]